VDDGGDPWGSGSSASQIPDGVRICDIDHMTLDVEALVLEAGDSSLEKPWVSFGEKQPAAARQATGAGQADPTSTRDHHHGHRPNDPPCALERNEACGQSANPKPKFPGALAMARHHW
jgi:hypothetical protein